MVYLHRLASGLAAALFAAPLAAAQTFELGGVELETLGVIASDFASTDDCHAVALHGGVAFAVGEAGSSYGKRWLIRARSASDGAELWSVDFALGPGLSGDGAFDVAVAPDGATLFVAGRMGNGTATASGATVLALDTSDGSTRWLAQVDSAALGGSASALAVSPDGQRVAITGWSDTGLDASSFQFTVAVLGAANGVVQWTWTHDEEPTLAKADEGRDVIFTLDGERVIATGNVYKIAKGTVYGTYAFDAADGSPSWSHLYEESEETVSVPAQLATNGSRVVVAGQHRLDSFSAPLTGTIALDVATGSLLWKAADSPIPGVERAFGVAAAGSDFLLGETAGFSFFTTRWSAARLDGATGQRVWETLVDEPALPFDSLLPVALDYSESADVLVLAGAQDLQSLDPTSTYDSMATGFDGTSGALLWRETWVAPGGIDDDANAVAVDGGAALIGGGSFVPTQGIDFTLRARDVGTGQLQWDLLEQAVGPASNTPRDVVVDPATGDPLVVGTVNGGAKAVVHAARLDGSTGAQQWAYFDEPGTESGGTMFRAQLSHDGATLFAAGSSGKDLMVLALDATTGDKIWRRTFNGPKNKSDGADDLVLSPDGSTVYTVGTFDAPSGFTQPDAERAMVTLALDAVTGADLWTAIHDPTDDDERGRFLALSLDGTLLFAVGTREREVGFSNETDLEVVAYDATSGNAVWVGTYDTAATLGGLWRDAPFAAAVSADGTRLWVAGTSQPSCCDSGRAALWTIDTANGGLLVEETTPIPNVNFVPRGAAIDVDSSAAVVVGEDKSLLGGGAVGFDLATGLAIWTREVPLLAPAYLVDVAISADGRTCYASGRFNDRSIPTVALDTATGDELWRAAFEPTGLTELVLTFGAFAITYDDPRRRVWTAGYGPLIGTDVEGLLLGYADPTLLGIEAALSLSAGGSQALDARAGPSFAGDVHLLLGSLSGTTPGLPLGALDLPLNVDSYTQLTLTQPGSAFLPGSLGVLDADGRASLALNVPPATNPAVAGLTAHHAYVVIDLGAPGLAVVLASNAIAADLVP